MLKLVQLVVFGTVLCALAFASSASAVGALGQIAGPLPIGIQASFNGAKCVMRAHTGGVRTLRIRRGSDGVTVGYWKGNTTAGKDYVVSASFFSLGGAGSRAVCEAFPVNVQPNSSEGQDVVDAQITLQSLEWYGKTIETVPGVSGAVAGPTGCLPGLCVGN